MITMENSELKQLILYVFGIFYFLCLAGAGYALLWYTFNWK
jgi:hypothetical protein